MEQFYPALSGSAFYAEIELNGIQTEVNCYPDGWIEILFNNKGEDVSSLTVQDFIDEGHDDFPFSQMMPLSTIHTIVNNKHF